MGVVRSSHTAKQLRRTHYLAIRLGETAAKRDGYLRLAHVARTSHPNDTVLRGLYVGFAREEHHAYLRTLKLLREREERELQDRIQNHSDYAVGRVIRAMGGF